MAGDKNYRILVLSFLYRYVKKCIRHDFSPSYLCGCCRLLLAAVGCCRLLWVPYCACTVLYCTVLSFTGCHCPSPVPVAGWHRPDRRTRTSPLSRVAVLRLDQTVRGGSSPVLALSSVLSVRGEWRLGVTP